MGSSCSTDAAPRGTVLEPTFRATVVPNAKQNEPDIPSGYLFSDDGNVISSSVVSRPTHGSGADESVEPEYIGSLMPLDEEQRHKTLVSLNVLDTVRCCVDMQQVHHAVHDTC